MGTRQFTAKELLPVNIRHQKGEKDWKSALREHQEQLRGTSKEEARERFLQYCIQLPFYGYHLVEVRPSSSSGWDLPSVFYVALHVSGLFFVSADKEVFYSFPFTDILKHVSTPFSLQIGFDHKQELEVL